MTKSSSLRLSKNTGVRRRNRPIPKIRAHTPVNAAHARVTITDNSEDARSGDHNRVKRNVVYM